MSLLSKVEDYVNTVGFTQKVSATLAKNKPTVSGGITRLTKNDALNLCDVFISDLSQEANSCGLPASVQSIVDTLSVTRTESQDIIKSMSNGHTCVVKGGRTICYLSFDHSLMHRDSWYPEKYGDGIRNILLLFETGYSASDYVYKKDGEGHVLKRSLKSRDGAWFIESALAKFNSSHKRMAYAYRSGD